jgi:hypothetical protein
VAKKKNPKGPAAEQSPGPARASELAAMVRGIMDAPDGLPILGDFLEEKLGLRETAALFRSAGLKALPEKGHSASTFAYYPLAEDVFLWLAAGRFQSGAKAYQTQPCTIVGLYAHPQGEPSLWAKITRMVEGEDDPEAVAARRSAWDPISKPDPQIEAVKAELAARAAG